MNTAFVCALLATASIVGCSTAATIEWRGVTWDVADSDNTTREPGTNVFASSNVAVSGTTSLDLSIVNRSGQPKYSCSEVSLRSSLSSGSFSVSGSFSSEDASVRFVFGLWSGNQPVVTLLLRPLPSKTKVEAKCGADTSNWTMNGGTSAWKLTIGWNGTTVVLSSVDNTSVPHVWTTSSVPTAGNLSLRITNYLVGTSSKLPLVAMLTNFSMHIPSNEKPAAVDSSPSNAREEFRSSGTNHEVDSSSVAVIRQSYLVKFSLPVGLTWSEAQFGMDISKLLLVTATDISILNVVINDNIVLVTLSMTPEEAYRFQTAIKQRSAELESTTLAKYIVMIGDLVLSEIDSVFHIEVALLPFVAAFFATVF